MEGRQCYATKHSPLTRQHAKTTHMPSNRQLPAGPQRANLRSQRRSLPRRQQPLHKIDPPLQARTGGGSPMIGHHWRQPQPRWTAEGARTGPILRRHIHTISKQSQSLGQHYSPARHPSRCHLPHESLPKATNPSTTTIPIRQHQHNAESRSNRAMQTRRGQVHLTYHTGSKGSPRQRTHVNGTTTQG